MNGIVKCAVACQHDENVIVLLIMQVAIIDTLLCIVKDQSHTGFIF